MKNFFLGGRVLCICLYVAAIVAWIAAGAWWWFLILALLHLAQALVFGIRIGSQHNKGIGYSFLATMLFGLFWWYALDKGYCD